MTNKLEQALQDIEQLPAEVQDIIAKMIEREIEWWKINSEFTKDDLINPKEKAKNSQGS